MTGDDEIAGLNRRVDELEAALRVLLDQRSVEDLVHFYQHLCDGGWNGPTHVDIEALVALFTPDAIYSLPGWETAHGSAEIRALFELLQARLPWIIHFVANPSVEVEGDSATGSIKGFAYYLRDGSRFVTLGTYIGDFTRTEAGWRFARWRFEAACTPIRLASEEKSPDTPVT